MPQPVHGHSYCSVRNFPLTVHYGGKKLGENRVRDGRILTPNKRVLTFRVQVYGVKFHQNRVRIVTIREVTDRRTDRHRDAGDFIICPMLCYSNGTDKKLITKISLSGDVITKISLYVFVAQSIFIIVRHQ